MEVVEVTLAVVETLVEEDAMVEVAAEVVMEEVMVDIMDLEVMVATMAVVLAIVAEEAVVVVEDQDMETKRAGNGGGSGGYDGCKEGGNFGGNYGGSGNHHDFGNYSTQQQTYYGPMRGVVLAEGAQAAPVVVVMDLVVEVLDVVAGGSKNSAERGDSS